jgi:hypothetical protein
MQTRSISSLDEARAAYPHLGMALYAMEPGQPVTLEVHTPDGQMFTFRARTEAGALARAFPIEDEPEIDIFG